MSTINSGSANQNSKQGSTLTWAQIVAFCAQSASNTISFAIYRNPSTAYAFIKQNYGHGFPNIKAGSVNTGPTMDSMWNFLLGQYNQLQPSQRQHFMANLIHSLPATAESINWTTPIDASATTTPMVFASPFFTN